MTDLLYKEFRLALHPTTVIFLFLALMLMIPNYPYYVVFFYTCLGVFFICLTGRENGDVEYMMMLPVKKSDIVKARISMVVVLQIIQIVICIPVIILRNSVMDMPNEVGMDANVALLALSLPMLGLFNLVFFTKYYKNVAKVGIPFLIGSILVFVYMGIAEMLAHILPFFRDVLDTPDPQNMGAKLGTLAAGAVIYALLTFAAYCASKRSFEKMDL